ncbi:MAG: hypothetical protein AAFY02_01265 [Pseudomonadota bacterium]
MRFLVLSWLVVGLLTAPGTLSGQELQQSPAPEAAEEDRPESRIERRVLGIEALEDLVAGRTQYRRRVDGTYEIEYHHPDGIAAYVWEGCVIYGEWWATPEEICFFYPDSELQGPHCFFIEEGEEGLEFWWSDDPMALQPTAITVKDVEGNVERLPLGVNGECLIS